jgi:hypothetical protein
VDLPILVAPTLMRDLTDRKRLAGEVIAFAETIALEKNRALTA